MADQDFALYAPPEVVTMVGGPLVHNQRFARELAPITPPSTVLSIAALEHRQVFRTVVTFAGQYIPVVHYQMTGSRVSGGAWITWTVTGVPDSSGTSAPQPVATASIAVTRRWTT